MNEFCNVKFPQKLMSFLISGNYFDKRSDDLQCKKDTPNYYSVNFLYILN